MLPSSNNGAGSVTQSAFDVLFFLLLRDLLGSAPSAQPTMVGVGCAPGGSSFLTARRTSSMVPLPSGTLDAHYWGDRCKRPASFGWAAPAWDEVGRKQITYWSVGAYDEQRTSCARADCLGRGATGFTTRSDIGPARPGAGPGGEAGAQAEGDVDENKFDEFMGNDAGALAGGTYDEDDKEADEIWDAVDKYMDERRRERREKRLKEEIERYRAENPKITEQFADLKRKLSEVSSDEWDAIPEIGDYTIKKKQMRQSFAPVPDTLLSKAAAEKQTSKSIDPALSGLTTPSPMGGTHSTVSDLTAIGEGRGTVLGLKLDRMADSVTGQTVVDPKGYLTDLKSMTLKSDADIADIKKARLLLKSVIQTNPNHAPGWVAIARLEELAGNFLEARKMLQEACERCPKSEDVWLEASRMYAKQSRENAKAVLARGVGQIPDSVRLWTAAAALETDKVAQLRVLKKALERVPYSVSLWKAAIELVDVDDAKVMLDRAVECCPNQVDLWLALARLETYDNAKKVLNRARKALPAEQSIWVTAAQLEEANGNADMADKIVTRALRALESVGVVVTRESWIGFAEQAERTNMVATCRALVRAIALYHIDDEDREATLVGDAEEALKKHPPCVEVSRVLYAIALENFPGKETIWRAAAQLEMTHGTPARVEELLMRAVKYCPQAEVLWLMAAKHRWRVMNDVPGARRVLEGAFEANPDSEEIWLAAVKLEFENDEVPRAKLLLSRARMGNAGSYARVWMKSAIVERQLGNDTEERVLLEEGIRRFPTFEKLYLQLGQLEERLGRLEAARAAYRRVVC
ncbi:TPR_REGION domain-containing protein [Haematococcus lacustris]|uniref:TPR_REGION domain-containing protein n=1 Tax=Haematococcus lacustris TaxID=44745 RepID=A0A699YGY1_HAELA|nr:TPR_REGION domain-containing protein [Haematococcus lacustris]